MGDQEEEEEDDPIEFANKLVHSIAKATPGLSKHMDAIKEKINNATPELKAGLKMTAVICSATADITGFVPLKIIGICLGGTAALLDSPGKELGFDSIEKHLDKIENKVNEIYGYVKMKDCRDGIEEIKIQYKDMIKNQKLSYENRNITYINKWREGFKHYQHIFVDKSKCFSYENLRELFQLTYENKCSNSMRPLVNIYQEIITLRVMYLHVNRVFYENQHGLETNLAKCELEDFARCMDDIKKAMSETCSFFHAVRTLKENRSKFDAIYFPNQEIFTEKLERKSTIKGLKSKIVKILGAKSLENLVLIETKHDYSIIGQTKNDDKSNKKDLEGFVCKKYKEGRMEIGMFKNKKEWKNGIMENWIGGVLDICKDVITFREYDENGKKVPGDLKFNQRSLNWKELKNFEYVDLSEDEDDEQPTPTKLQQEAIQEEEEEALEESSGQQIYDDMLNLEKGHDAEHSLEVNPSQSTLKNDGIQNDKIEEHNLRSPEQKIQFDEKEVFKDKVHNANPEDYSQKLTNHENNARQKRYKMEYFSGNSPQSSKAELEPQSKLQEKFPQRDYENEQRNMERKNYINPFSSIDQNIDNSGIKLFIPADVINDVEFNIQISNSSRNSKLIDECNTDTPKISLNDTRQLATYKDIDIDSSAVSSTNGLIISTPRSTVREQLTMKIRKNEANNNSSVSSSIQEPNSNSNEEFEDFGDAENSSEILSNHDQRTSTPRKSSPRASDKLQESFNNNQETLYNPQGTLTSPRNTAQYQRNSAQSQRNSAQSQRNSAQSQRNSDQFQRNSAQSQRNSAQSQRNSDQFQRNSAQSERSSAQSQRNSDQYQRNSDQSQRNSAQSQRNSAQSQRNSVQSQRNSDQFQRNSAQSEKSSAQTLRNSDQYQRNTDQSLRDSVQSPRNSGNTKPFLTRNRKRQDTETKFPHIEDTIKKLGFTEYAINTWKRPILIKDFFDTWYYKTFGFTSVVDRLTNVTKIAKRSREVWNQDSESRGFSKINENESKQSLESKSVKANISEHQGNQTISNHKIHRNKNKDALKSPNNGKVNFKTRMSKNKIKTNIPELQGKQSKGKISIFYEIDRNTKQRKININTTDLTLQKVIKKEFESKKGQLTVPQLYELLEHLDVQESAN